jgi:Fic family protein
VVKSSEIEGEALNREQVRSFNRALRSVLGKARFWEAHGTSALNERQRAMINRLLDGFEGKLTSSKWASLTKFSQDRALRDIDGLVARGMAWRIDARPAGH